MIGILAGIAVFIWLAGLVGLAVLLPRELHRIPLLSIAADLQPALVAAWFALVTVAWPAIPIYALLEKLTERRKP